MSGSVPMFEQGSFAGHETFPFRYTWLPKAMAFVASEPDAFGREDAMVELGVGKNMVKSMRHWALACGILEEVPATRGRQVKTTELGTKLFGAAGWDPFLEDHGTLWLLHAKLAAVPDWATTWYWVFNHLPQPEFSKAELCRWLMDFVTERKWGRVAETSIRRDVDCFLGSYVASEPKGKTPVEDTLDCPLVELRLVREMGRSHYVVSRGSQRTLPEELVAWSLAELLHRMGMTTGTVSLDKIAYAPGSPGRIFCLSEDSLVAYLERLGELTLGAALFDDTAGLRQVLLTRPLNGVELLDRYYTRSQSTQARRRST